MIMFTRAEYRARFEREPNLFPRAAYNARFERELAPMKQETGSRRRVGAWFRQVMFRSRPTTPVSAATAKLRSVRSGALKILYYGL